MKSNFQLKIDLQANLEGIFLIKDSCGQMWPAMGNASPRQVVLGCKRKLSQQVTDASK